MYYKKVWKTLIQFLLHLNGKKAGAQTKQRTGPVSQEYTMTNQDLNNVFLKTLGLSQKDCGTFEAKSLLKNIDILPSGFPKITQLNDL